MHGSNVSGQIDKTSFAPGETMTFTINAGTRTGWWRAGVVDQAGNVVKTASVASGTSTTVTVPAPAAAGTYAYKVAWYGNQYGVSPGAGWVPDSGNPNHGYQTVAVTSFSVAAPAAATVALDPGSLSFGSVNVGATASLTAQVRNTGTSPLTISNIGRCASPATSAEYAWSPTSLPITVAPGASAALAVSYSPTGAGTDSGCLALTSNATNGPTTNLAVSGTGVVPAAPKIAVSPASLAFGNVTVGASSAKTFTVSNTGSATLTGTLARASGTSAEYAVAPASLSVAPGGSQVVTVTYAPTDTSADSGAISVSTNDATNANVSVGVSGTGIAAPAPNISLAPASLAFGTVATGGTASLTAQVRNTGTAPLTVSQIARCTTPVTSDEFAWSPGGPITVAAGGSATVTVTYAPTGAGADTGCLAFTSDDVTKPVVSLDVSGTGQVPSAPKLAVSPASLAFGSVTTGTQSAKTFTISNPGNAPLTGTLARASGTSAEYTLSAASFSVAAGASQVVTVTYAPADVGADAGAIALTSNDPATPSASVGVSGSGVAAPTPAITVAPSSLGFGTVLLGSSASLTAEVRNSGTAALDVTGIALCSGTSAAFGWTPVAPFSVAPGQAATVTVSYRPTAAGTDSGCLALASNDPASPLVNLAVSGTAAAEAVPSIAVDPAALDFGTVTVGSTASRTTQVRNTGNGALDVTGISLCDGTPAAFSVSPAAPFTVAPGESVTLTTTYAPTAAATDSGCFAIASSDPAHASENVSLTGTGAQAPVPSADADVDIEEFKVPKRVENPVGASVTPLLHLRNLSQIDATASATLTGVLNGAKVYEETIPVTLAASEDGEVAFPPYVPAGARGIVRWTVTVADQDPDADQAIARTMLGRPSRDAVASRDATDLADLEVLEDVEFQERESSLLSADGASTSGGCSSGSGGAGFVTLLSLGLVAMRRRRSALRARH